jgi:hypothetical protein
LSNSGLPDLHIECIGQVHGRLACGSNSKGFHFMEGDKWRTYNTGIICSSVPSISATEDGIIACTDHGVFVSDNGHDWDDVTPVVEFDLFRGVGTMNERVFLSVEYNADTRPYDRPFILYSNDLGQQWSELISPVPFAGDDPYKIYCEDGTLYAREDEMMAATSDLGQTWRDLSLPSEYCNYMTGLVVHNAQVFASACAGGQVLRLRGNSWELSNTGLPGSDIKTLINSSDAIYAFVQPEGMYVSLDEGNTWKKSNRGLEDVFSIRSFTYCEEGVFISTLPDGIYYKASQGSEWDALFAADFPPVLSMLALNDTLYAGTYNHGIWKREILSFTSGTGSLDVPGQVSLYPNPSSGFLCIDIGNETGVPQHFSLYSLEGKLVLSKVLTRKNKIDISGLDEGMYIYELRMGKTKLQSGKVIKVE